MEDEERIKHTWASYLVEQKAAVDKSQILALAYLSNAPSDDAPPVMLVVLSILCMCDGRAERTSSYHASADAWNDECAPRLWYAPAC
jgi:hypothetical protein